MLKKYEIIFFTKMLSFSSQPIIHWTDLCHLSHLPMCRLQMRLHEILKENKEAKSTSSLLEHKMDELTEENSILSSQVMMLALLSLMFYINIHFKIEGFVHLCR